MAAYPIELTPDDNNTFLVTSPALPEVTSFGATREAALIAAQNAVLEALAARMSADEDIPLPMRFARKGSDVIELNSTVALKISLQRAMKDRNVSRAELARRLGWHREQVDRLFRIGHVSRLDQLSAALAAVGYTFDHMAWRVEDDAPLAIAHHV